MSSAITSPEDSVNAPSNRVATLPVSVIIAARNEEKNLPRCLKSLNSFEEVYVVDSQSSDATVAIAEAYHAKVVQFHYKGGWPKKRQWALDNLPIASDWILLLDADEALTPEIGREIQCAISKHDFNGYYIALQMRFLGKELRHCGANFYKLSLFRKGIGRFECRLQAQDSSMADMEVHEHVVVEGPTAKLKNPIAHHNVDSLAKYIQKHNEYSNWDAAVWVEGKSADLPPTLFGNQAQRRRWLKQRFFAVPGSPVVLFLYRYFFCLGFLDGIPGLAYCAFQAIQMFHIKAKVYEMKLARRA